MQLNKFQKIKYSLKILQNQSNFQIVYKTTNLQIYFQQKIFLFNNTFKILYIYINL